MTQDNTPSGSTLHPLVRAWLDRFEALTVQLSPERVLELRTDLMEHLNTGLGVNPSEEHVQNVLRELGDPADVVAEAASDFASSQEGAQTQTPLAAPVQPTIWKEATALALLAAAPVLLILPPIAVIAWIFGVALLWMSRIWSFVDKLWGMVLAMVPSVVLIGGLVSFNTIACVETSGGGELADPVLPNCADLPPPWILPLIFVVLLGLAVYAFVRLALKTSRARAA